MSSPSRGLIDRELAAQARERTCPVSQPLTSLSSPSTPSAPDSPALQSENIPFSERKFQVSLMDRQARSPDGSNRSESAAGMHSSSSGMHTHDKFGQHSEAEKHSGTAVIDPLSQLIPAGTTSTPIAEVNIHSIVEDVVAETAPAPAIATTSIPVGTQLYLSGPQSIRRELRSTDNPILHHISELLSKDRLPFTHLLPVYVFPARQVEICGFLDSATATESPYPPARSVVAGFPRCGPHRAKFWAESVWNFKSSLESIGSGVAIRVGRIDDILENILDEFKHGNKDCIRDDGSKLRREVVGVWITAEDGVAEKTDERNVFRVAGLKKVPVRVWKDEKYLIDDRDLPYVTSKDVPDCFIEFRETAGCLRTRPRKPLPRPVCLPPLPSHIPAQPAPFKVPNTLDGWIAGLLKPLYDPSIVTNTPTWPLNFVSPHTHFGGEAYALERLKHLITYGPISTYRDAELTFVGDDHSTSLAAWLALGCITARQINEYLVDFEDGQTALGQHVDGYGDGENEWTAGLRAELLWRDYLRLCTSKYGCKLFRLEGFKGDMDRAWKHGDEAGTKQQIQRFIEGRTGVPIVDAALREIWGLIGGLELSGSSTVL
ncbi:hypothetical protein ABW21_db0200384 [Orbilia brochopaga]|nr:hypothetical protein ABW21_db0200384 [Drechslerella brochopaga]